VGIRAQYRNQSHGTHKFLLNALLYPQTVDRAGGAAKP
jgi:hypothetical protein